MGAFREDKMQVVPSTQQTAFHTQSSGCQERGEGEEEEAGLPFLIQKTLQGEEGWDGPRVGGRAVGVKAGTAGYTPRTGPSTDRASPPPSQAMLLNFREAH